MLKILNIITLLSLSLSMLSHASDLTLSSTDIAEGKMMKKAQEFNGFGCNGDDISPQLSWDNAPKGTKSFAITSYDPDAPTGSGWWHWQIVNIDKKVSTLKADAGNAKKDYAPKGSVQVANDYGVRGFGGACPPKGNGKHRYRFTVHALSVEKLDLPENASGALTGFMINSNTIASATIEAFYQRN